MAEKSLQKYQKIREKTKLPKSLQSIHALRDFEPAARRTLPSQLFHYYYSAVEERATYDANREIFSEYEFVPNSLIDTTGRDLSVDLLGKKWDLPFGIPPMGLSALATYEGDIVMAKTAHEMGMPSIMSAASLIPLEDVAAAAPNRWFQAYLPGENDRIDPMLKRIEKAGFETLVLTVDVPQSGNPENQVREGFASPLPKTPSLFWQFLSHPKWLFGTALKTVRNKGIPSFDNMDAQHGPPIISKDDIARDFGNRDGLSWEHAKRMRDQWKGRFLIKGILSAHDTRIAKDIGCDGVIVSNHGGRQLDTAITSLAALPDCVESAGDMPVMIDSGFRRGADVLKAYALGASFVFVGRPYLYAASVAGAEGIRHCTNLLRDEISRNMAMLGVTEITKEALAPLISKRQR